MGRKARDPGTLPAELTPHLMKKRIQSCKFEASPSLARKLEKIQTSVMESELLDTARSLADNPKTPLKVFEQLEPLMECALPDCLWTAAEWDATKHDAAARWKRNGPKGAPRSRDQREADRQAFMRLCADYRIARKAGAGALKRWLDRRSPMELAALALIEEAEAPVVDILCGLVIQKLTPVEVLADE